MLRCRNRSWPQCPVIVANFRKKEQKLKVKLVSPSTHKKRLHSLAPGTYTLQKINLSETKNNTTKP